MPDATFYPNLHYRDAEAAMRWLEEALGFERRAEHRDEAGVVQHAELSLGSAFVMLGTAGAGREPFSSVAPLTSTWTGSSRLVEARPVRNPLKSCLRDSTAPCIRRSRSALS